MDEKKVTETTNEVVTSDLVETSVSDEACSGGIGLGTVIGVGAAIAGIALLIRFGKKKLAERKARREDDELLDYEIEDDFVEEEPELSK